MKKQIFGSLLLASSLLLGGCSIFNKQDEDLYKDQVGVMVLQDSENPGKGYARLSNTHDNPVSVCLQVMFDEGKQPAVLTIPTLNTGEYAQLMEFSFPEGNRINGVEILTVQETDKKSALDDMKIENVPSGQNGLEYTATNNGSQNIWFTPMVLTTKGTDDPQRPITHFGEGDPILIKPGETVTSLVEPCGFEEGSMLYMGCYAEYQ